MIMKKLPLLLIVISLIISGCNSYERKLEKKMQEASDEVYAKEGDSVLNGIVFGMTKEQLLKCPTDFKIDDYDFVLSDVEFISDSLRYVSFQTRRSYLLYPDYYPDGLENMPRSETDFVLANQAYTKVEEMLLDRYWTKQRSRYESMFYFDQRWTYIKKVVALRIDYYDEETGNELDGGLDGKYYRVYLKFIQPQYYDSDRVDSILRTTPKDSSRILSILGDSILQNRD